MLEQSLVYLPFQYCDISGISLQPNQLCVSLCGETEICLPHIPAVAPAGMLLGSCTAKHTMWDRGMLLHPAAVFCLGESCITPVVRQDSPPTLHTETQPSSWNRGSDPTAEVLAGPVYALAAREHLESLDKKQQMTTGD